MRVAVIPARGGSRRIPHKNRRLFHGKPIIAYSIELARQHFDRVVVSTDDAEIMDIAIGLSAQIIERPPELAVDEIGTQEVTRHAIEALRLDRNDYVCCLYATAPLATLEDLYWAHTLIWARPALYVVAVGTNPLRDAGQWYYGMAGHFLDDLPLYGVRSAIYDVGPRAIDINTLEDWDKAERMYTAMRDGVPFMVRFSDGKVAA